MVTIRKPLHHAVFNGVAENGNTAVLDADTVGSTEGFSVGRGVRLGIRLRL